MAGGLQFSGGEQGVVTAENAGHGGVAADLWLFAYFPGVAIVAGAGERISVLGGSRALAGGSHVPERLQLFGGWKRSIALGCRLFLAAENATIQWVALDLWLCPHLYDGLH